MISRVLVDITEIRQMTSLGVEIASFLMLDAMNEILGSSANRAMAESALTAKGMDDMDRVWRAWLHNEIWRKWIEESARPAGDDSR